MAEWVNRSRVGTWAGLWGLVAAGPVTSRERDWDCRDEGLRRLKNMI